MPKFERYESPVDRTFALRAFNRFETEVNEHFWSFKVIAERSNYLARQAAKVDPDQPTATLFSATGPDARRIPTTVTEWMAAESELENWLRLSALVSASSYLEYYLRQVTRSALMSDPLRRFGLARSLDGVSLLKKNQELPYEDEQKAVTKGSWGQRNAAFESIFGARIPYITSSESTLESIREIRNEHAHGFGRKLLTPEPSVASIPSSRRLSQARFLALIGTISKAAAAVDKYLLDHVIGSFEFIHFYHRWKDAPRTGRDASYTEQRALKAALVRESGYASDIVFAQELIEYYRGA